MNHDGTQDTMERPEAQALKRSCTAEVRGHTGFEEVNLRSAPSIHAPIIVTLPIGTRGLKVLDAQPDGQAEERDGQVFQWFQIEGPRGRTGWVRDDLITLEGDCWALGYGVLAKPVLGRNLTRDERKLTYEAQERIRRAAFNITSSFEGGSYTAYQTYDSGVVSYGRFQFTLASGSLFTVVDAYINARPFSWLANELRARYYSRLRERDVTLRDEERLKTLLQAVAKEKAMQTVQDQAAIDLYWTRVQHRSVIPRGIKTALGQALLFDMGMNHGPYNTLVEEAEVKLEIDPWSKVDTPDGVSEKALLTEVAALRRDRLYELARVYGYGGLKVRADFWMGLVTREDWHLQGDSHGEVTTYPTRRVQVREP